MKTRRPRALGHPRENPGSCSWEVTGLLIVVASAAGAGPRTPISGTSVVLVVPEGFEVATDFPGIIRRDSGATIHVGELPVPVEEPIAGFTAPRFASKGMTLLRSEKVDARFGPATLFHLSQSAQGIDYRKWVLVGVNATRSVLLTATVPAVLQGEVESVLVDALLTASWNPAIGMAGTRPGDFPVSETPGLEFADARSEDLIVLVRSDEQKSIGLGDPSVIITRCTDPIEVSDLPYFSMKELASHSRLTDIMIEEESEKEIDGLPAYEIVASGRDVGDRPAVLYQTYVSDRHHCYKILGIVGEQLRHPYVQYFRTVAESLSVER